MLLLDHLFGWIQRYRRLRGGTWFYASCPDGGWMRKDKPFKDFPRVEEY
jgi:hypothetical protein